MLTMEYCKRVRKIEINLTSFNMFTFTRSSFVWLALYKIIMSSGRKNTKGQYDKVTELNVKINLIVDFSIRSRAADLIVSIKSCFFFGRILSYFCIYTTEQSTVTIIESYGLKSCFSKIQYLHLTTMRRGPVKRTVICHVTINSQVLTRGPPSYHRRRNSETDA